MKLKHENPILACGLAALLVGTAGCGSTPAPGDGPPPGAGPEDIVLTTVDGVELTLADALETFLSSHMGHGSLVQGEAAVRELVGRIVERRLFLAEAEALGAHDVAEVTAAVDLKRLELAKDRFWRREVDEKVVVTDQEVEDFYARTDMALSVHYLEVEDRDAAEALRRQVAEGADFEKLAEEHSIHPSRDFGGLMDYVRRGDLEPAIENEVFALEEKGALTPVVATKKGFAFARFDEKTTNPNRPPREVALPQIRNVLEERAKEALEKEVKERLLREADVTFDESLLTRDEVLATTTPEAVLARAAGEEYTLAELRDDLNLDAVRQSTDEAAVRKALRGIVRDWARGWALQRAVETAGLTEDPDIQEQVERYREDLELGWLYNHYIYADLDPTEEDARAFYDEHKEDLFTRPEELRLAYIVVGTEDEANAVLQRLENGEDFGTIAKQVSIDTASSVHGGKISWVRPGRMLPAVEEVAFALEVGQYGGPVETESGWFVLHLLERKEPFLVPFAASKRKATIQLSKERQSEAYSSWAERLRERADVEINEAGLRQAVAWLEREAEKQAAEKEAAEAARLAEEEKAAAEVVGPMPDRPADGDAGEDAGGSR